MTATDQRALVEETLSHFREIVTADGGTLAIASLEDNHLRVAYEKGTNDRCYECVITHEDLAVFITEALEVRSAGIVGLEIIDPSEGTGD